MTTIELQLGKDKGLYYWCDNKFSLNHKCPNRQFVLLQLHEDNTEDLQDSNPNPLKILGKTSL